ncbi:MAG: hypothetical protein WDZ74_01595 [Candidatus Paceibacterota bacterium]
MDNPLLQRILLHTYTKSDFYRTLDVAQEYLEHAFYNTDDTDDTEHVERLVRYAESQGDVLVAERLQAWGEPVLSLFTRENLYEKLKELREAFEGLPEMVLYTPVQFGKEEVTTVGTWCRENLDRNIVLSMHVEQSVVGGCAFVWNGTYHDFSLDYFLNKKQGEITHLIRSNNVRS